MAEIRGASVEGTVVFPIIYRVSALSFRWLAGFQPSTVGEFGSWITFWSEHIFVDLFLQVSNGKFRESDYLVVKVT